MHFTSVWSPAHADPSTPVIQTPVIWKLSSDLTAGLTGSDQQCQTIPHVLTAPQPSHEARPCGREKRAFLPSALGGSARYQTSPQIKNLPNKYQGGGGRPHLLTLPQIIKLKQSFSTLALLTFLGSVTLLWGLLPTSTLPFEK